MTQFAPVSVIIPCFRCAATIARAVQSVIAQTLPPAEILLVEDGSDDGGRTMQALQKLEREHRGRIRLIALAANAGAASARNRGWDEATQPCLAFLDADDAWHPRKLEIQYGWMRAHPEAAFCGHLIEVVSQEKDTAPPTGAVSATRLGRGAWLFSCRFSTISVMLRRDLPFRFAPGKRHAEDYLLWLRIVLNGQDAWRIEAPLAFCFKPLYGSGGLSASLWQAEAGELDAYRRIYREGLVSFATLATMMVWSVLKYLRRLALSAVRNGAPGRAAK